MFQPFKKKSIKIKIKKLSLTPLFGIRQHYFFKKIIKSILINLN